MVRCPVCDSQRVVVVVSQDRRAFCARCGSKWRQEGSLQRAVRRSRTAKLAGNSALRLVR